MALQVEDHGADNQVLCGAADHAGLTGRIVFFGRGARVAIGAGCVDAGMRIEAGDGAEVSIGANGHLGALFIHACAGSRVVIGDGIGVNGLSRLLLHEAAAILIGEGCLLASDVDISVSDMHPIFDLAGGHRINAAEDVVIGERVWIGQRCLVLKGATIGHDAVVGAGSVVVGLVPAHSVAAGNPARIVRTGVRWAMDLPG